jgi:oligopeptide transport system ATP-binding protein
MLSVRDLTVQLRTADGVAKAVNGVSLDVAKGESLAIVGESGSGKSVTMLSMLRLLPSPPAEILSGEVLFEGKDLAKVGDEELRRIRGGQIGFVFQDPMSSLNPVKTVGRQIAESLKLHLGMDRTAARNRAVELLRLVGIPSAEKRLDDCPHQFSGGMRQRVMIAIALACKPILLVADEPTTALDVTIQAQIIDLVQRLQAELGMGVIWISHDLGVVARLASRVVVMYAGRVMEDAPVRTIFRNPRHPYTMGLLRSAPRIDRAPQEGGLWSIGGLPPNLLDYPVGCPFAARCPLRIEECSKVVPVPRAVGQGHRIACIRDVYSLDEAAPEPDEVSRRPMPRILA